MPKAKGKKCRQTGKKKARVEDNTDDVQGSSSSSAAAAAAAAVPGEGSSSSSSSALPTTPGLVKIGRKKRGVGFLPPKNEEPPIVLLLGTKNEEPPSSIFSTGRMDEEPTPGYSFYDPPGHQLFSAILTFGSSDRSSSLKIGPRIGIGPLLASATVRMVKDPDPLWQRARCPSVRVMRRDVRSSSCVRMHASRQHASERRIHTRPLAEEAASRMRRSEVRGEGRRCHREASARGGPDVGDAIAPTPRCSQ